MRILKYTLKMIREQVVKIPAPARIISAIEQHNKVVIYAVVNSKADMIINRTIRILKTGEYFPDNHQCRFINSVSIGSGDHTLHVFEKISETKKGTVIELIEKARNLPKMEMYSQSCGNV